MRDREMPLSPFVATLAAAAIPCVAGYCLLVHPYQRLILGLVDGALTLSGARASLWVGPNGHWGVLPPGNQLPLEIGGPRYALGFFLAAAIVPPLVAAHPSPWIRRIQQLFVAAICVVLFHAASVTLLVVLGATSCDGGFASTACGNIKGSMIYVNQVVPIVIWWSLQGLPRLAGFEPRARGNAISAKKEPAVRNRT